MTIDCPRPLILASRSSTLVEFSELSCPVGSSAKSTSGSLIRARTMAARCASPPETMPGNFFRVAASMSTRSKSSTARRATSARLRLVRRPGAMTLSISDMESKRFICWKTKPQCERRKTARRSCEALEMSVPSKTTVPSVGRSMPDSAYRSVDLPAPDGPMTTVKSPRRIRRSMFFRTCCWTLWSENVLDSFFVEMTASASGASPGGEGRSVVCALMGSRVEGCESAFLSTFLTDSYGSVTRRRRRSRVAPADGGAR